MSYWLFFREAGFSMAPATASLNDRRACRRFYFLAQASGATGTAKRVAELQPRPVANVWAQLALPWVCWRWTISSLLCVAAALLI